MTIKLGTPEEVDLLADAGGGFSGGHGPRITATIVGVIRSPFFSDGVDGPGVVLPSSGLFRRYRANLLGASGRSFTTALARLTDGAAGVPRLRAQMAALTGFPVQIDDLSVTARHHDRLTSFQALTVLAFGLAALVVAAVTIGVYVARTVEASQADLRVLRAEWADAPRRRRPPPRWAWSRRGWPAACSASAGGGGGVDLDAGRRRRQLRTRPGPPARRADPGPPARPGPGADRGGGGACSPGPRRTPPCPPARSIAALALVRLNLPVQVVTGLRCAVSRTVAGTLAGIVGLVAALTFSAGVTDASGDLSRFGQTHQAMAFLGYNGDAGGRGCSRRSCKIPAWRAWWTPWSPPSRPAPSSSPPTACRAADRSGAAGGRAGHAAEDRRRGAPGRQPPPIGWAPAWATGSRLAGSDGEGTSGSRP